MSETLKFQICERYPETVDLAFISKIQQTFIWNRFGKCGSFTFCNPFKTISAILLKRSVKRQMMSADVRSEYVLYSLLQSIHLSSVSIDLVLIKYRTLDIQAHVVGDISVKSVWHEKWRHIWLTDRLNSISHIRFLAGPSHQFWVQGIRLFCQLEKHINTIKQFQFCWICVCLQKTI